MCNFTAGSFYGHNSNVVYKFPDAELTSGFHLKSTRHIQRSVSFADAVTTHDNAPGR